MDANQRELDRQHNKWLEPPEETDTEPVRAKITVTFEHEYEFQRKYYPDGMTAEEMLALDVDNYSGDFMLLIDHPDTQMTTLKGELI